jgi:hypothetical protein
MILVITHLWVIPQIHLFSKIKIKKIKIKIARRLIFWQKHAERISQVEKNQSTILNGIGSLIIPYFTQN